MDSEINQFGLDGGGIDNSYEVSANDFKALTDDIGGSLNTASDTLLEAVEPLRSCAETEPLLAPLDDILKDIYDIKTSLASSPTMTYPMVSSSSHTMLHNFTSPINNMCYGNYMNSENPYDMPSSSYGMNYLSNSGNTFMSSSAMQMPMPMMTNSAMENIPEEENDSGPVYLNFNIDSMAPATIPSFPKGPPQVNQNTIGFDKPNTLDGNLKYMEYLNENGETARTRYVDNNINSINDNRTIRQNAINAINLSKPAENKMNEMEPKDEGCSKYLYTNNNLMNAVENSATSVTEAIYQNNCYLIKQNCRESTAPINNTFEWTNVTPKAQKELSAEVIFCRPPLQTKRTIRENPTVSVDFITDGNTNQTLDLNYITVLDNSDVQIPTISNRPKTDRKRRKQELKIRDWEDSVSFEQLKTVKSEDYCNNQEKGKTPPSCQTPSSSKKDALSEEMFLGKRKKKNCPSPNETVNWIGDDPDYKPFTEVLLPGRRRLKPNTPTTRDSYKTRNSERIKKLHDNESAQGSSNEILASSDSDLEDLATLASKSLKCPKCKKIFKTPRSLAIHQKRCKVQVENESDLEVTMVEYLESEKEFDDTDEISFVGDTGLGTTTVTVIEKILCDESKSEETVSKEVAEVLEVPETSKVVEKIEENPLRRNTRSQTNLNASKKLNQGNEKSNEIKQSNNQIKSKTTKTTSNNARNSRRKKNK